MVKSSLAPAGIRWWSLRKNEGPAFATVAVTASGHCLWFFFPDLFMPMPGTLAAPLCWGVIAAKPPSIALLPSGMRLMSWEAAGVWFP